VALGDAAVVVAAGVGVGVGSVVAVVFDAESVLPSSVCVDERAVDGVECGVSFSPSGSDVPVPSLIPPAHPASRMAPARAIAMKPCLFIKI
jgi:hypothetical protein